MMIDVLRDIKLDIIAGKYKCISAYKIPDKSEEWLNCPDCGLKPLVWEYNNGRSTGCGCGENEYNHFSIWAESIMSHVTRYGGSALEYDSFEAYSTLIPPLDKMREQKLKKLGI